MLAFAPQNSLRHQVKMLFNDPFSTVHHYWNWFDAALLIPYFAVMIILALYGVHRYTLCYLYFRYRKNYDPNPPRHFDELPCVTVQLPIFNEQFVIDRLVEAVCAMEYPREKLDIQVLDDSADEQRRWLPPLWPGTRLWAIPSPTSTVPTATALRRVRWMPDLKSPKASM